MRKQSFLLFFFGLLCFSAVAQKPVFNYQAIARNAQTYEPYRQQDLKIDVAILDKNKIAIYTENHDKTTSGLGVFTLSIGAGQNPSGTDLANITWADGPFYLKVDIDPGGSLGETPLVYVPYALYARESGSSQATSISQMGATNGQILQWNGTAWVPVNPPNQTYTGGTGITINAQNQINNSGDTNPADDLTNSTAFTGEVTGTYNSLQIADNAVTTNNIANGTITVADLAVGLLPTTLPPSGAAGGDLSGTYPSPTVVQIQGKAVAGATPVSGQVLKWNAASNRWEPATDNIGTSGSTYTAGAGIQINAQNDIINTGDTDASDDITTTSQAMGDLTGTFNTLSIGTGAVGSSEIANGSITLADLAPGVLPTTLPPNGPASGDLSGNYPGPTVAQIQGRAVASTVPTTGQVLQWNGTAWTPTNFVGDNWGTATVQHDATLTGNGTTGSQLALALNSVDSNYIKAGSISATDLSQMGATTSQVLQWNGTAWVPETTGWLTSGNTIVYTPNRKVGIGLNNPTHELEVKGDVFVRQSGSITNDDGEIVMADANDDIRVQMTKEYFDKSTDFRTDILVPGAVAGDMSRSRIQFFRNTTADEKLVEFYQGDEFGTARSAVIGVDQANSFFQATGGNLGVGLTDPQRKLDVAGNIGVRQTGDLNTNDGEIFMTDADGFDRVNFNKQYFANETNLRLELLVPQVPNNIARMTFFKNTEAVTRVVEFYGATGLAANIGTDSENSYFQATSGNFGIGTNNPSFLLEVAGAAAKPGGGSWTNSSDRRLKKDIKPFLSGLDIIQKVEPVTYRYNGLLHLPTEKEYVGVIAQELQKVVPSMVSEYKGNDGNNYLAVDPSAFDFILINAVKEQQKTIEAQQKAIRDLQAQQTNTDRQLTALRTAVEALTTAKTDRK